MAIQSYVLVSNDPANLVILGGPLRWDGETAYTPPAGTHTMLTDAAITAGYTFPAPPVAQVNAQTLQAKAGAAVDANNTYLAIASPTNAQVVAQVNRLTRECSAVIKLLLNQTDDTAGT